MCLVDFISLSVYMVYVVFSCWDGVLAERNMFEWFGVCQDLRRRSRMNNFKWTDGTINDTLALMFMN